MRSTGVEKKKLLVVEDDSVQIQVLATRLKNDGYEVAIARDADSIVPANAYHMATAIEPTQAAIARIAAAGSALATIKRLG